MGFWASVIFEDRSSESGGGLESLYVVLWESLSILLDRVTSLVFITESF